MIDAPGGGGKVPINPDYVEEITADEIVMRNYEGKRYRYPLVNGAVPVAHNLDMIQGGMLV